MRDRPAQLALTLEAQFAAHVQRADAMRYRDALDSLLALGPRGDRVAATGNLVLAALWQRDRQSARALTAMERWYAGVGASMDRGMLAPYILGRARAHAALGHRDEALQEYRRYVAYRATAEPAERAALGQVREEMLRLEVR